MGEEPDLSHTSVYAGWQTCRDQEVTLQTLPASPNLAQIQYLNTDLKYSSVQTAVDRQ